MVVLGVYQGLATHNGDEKMSETTIYDIIEDVAAYLDRMATESDMTPAEARDAAHAGQFGDRGKLAYEIWYAHEYDGIVGDAVERWQAASTEKETVTLRVWDDGESVEKECAAGSDYEAIARELWAYADYGDGDYRVTVGWKVTDSEGDIIDCGSFDLIGETEEPDCPEADEHDWTSEFEGGCTENPGVWSTGGTSMLFVSHCRNCGMKRTGKTTGSQRNPGECDTTEYSDPDPEWVAEHCPKQDEE